MTAYYNEIDPFAAQWLRNLIEAGHIAAGVVDERSIEDVTPGDLRGFKQCHFFAGIGVWSYALRQAGWADDRPVWTGSCPCQPFSAAGKGAGFDDERHLWPAFQWLIEKCRPKHVFGEQVAAGNANAWFDLVQSDLEGMGYNFGLTPFTSASVGAPHIRERAYWVADTDGEQHSELLSGLGEGFREGIGWQAKQSTGFCSFGIVADTDSKRLQRERQNSNAHRREKSNVRQAGLCNGAADIRTLEVNGFWRDADWILCRDGKWRPVESGTFPLVARFTKGMGHGKSSLRAVAGRNRVGRLKGYGNAINAEAAKHFIEAFMAVESETGN